MTVNALAGKPAPPSLLQRAPHPLDDAGDLRVPQARGDRRSPVSRDGHPCPVGAGVRERALRSATTHRHDYLAAYVGDLSNLIDMQAIRAAGIRLGVDPLGGAAVCVSYLFRNRPQWRSESAVGKTIVSSMMIDRAAGAVGRRLYETPVGFKWFVGGLLDASLGFAGEESAGASLLRRDGTVWTTDKDGIALALLAAEITAREDRDPAELYRSLTRDLGDPAYERVDAPATAEEKRALARLSAEQIRRTQLAGERIQRVLTRAPGNGVEFGGVKVVTASGWFVARPSGTENVYKIYAESVRGAEHLRSILEEAQAIVAEALAAAAPGSGGARGEPPAAVGSERAP